jgi:hypothetical protein
LVEIVARVEGMDPATVSLIARNVREAGLISTGGRGLSAAKMTLADAVNLLIAVNATVTAREAPQTVRNYCRLETVVGLRSAPSPQPRGRIQLGDALKHLIVAASNRTLQSYLSSTVPVLISQEFYKEQVQIEFVFHKPTPYAYLTISALDGSISVTGGIHPGDASFDILFKDATKIEFEFNLPSDQVKRHARKHYGDRKDTTSIGYPTIRAIGKLFGEIAER